MRTWLSRFILTFLRRPDDALDKADFRGLKRENGVSGLDGDDISITGFRTRKSLSGPSSQTNHVHRWALHRSTLEKPFLLVLKLSGNKESCIGVE